MWILPKRQANCWVCHRCDHCHTSSPLSFFCCFSDVDILIAHPDPRPEIQEQRRLLLFKLVQALSKGSSPLLTVNLAQGDPIMRSRHDNDMFMGLCKLLPEHHKDAPSVVSGRMRRIDIKIYATEHFPYVSNCSSILSCFRTHSGGALSMYRFSRFAIMYFTGSDHFNRYE